ncbi:hypothetical protein HDU87_001372 [Geranomyces variabilis]|uniref:Uncharacterized protein n=1 Tax=Geranomyces variabilis TaxID=109894 RepID=A0AAD5TPQ6_9FUNG|nr:hypothetical protein HDU87_001372 [Geranomyces variabilis]
MPLPLNQKNYLTGYAYVTARGTCCMRRRSGPKEVEDLAKAAELAKALDQALVLHHGGPMLDCFAPKERVDVKDVYNTLAEFSQHLKLGHTSTAPLQIDQDDMGPAFWGHVLLYETGPLGIQVSMDDYLSEAASAQRALASRAVFLSRIICIMSMSYKQMKREQAALEAAKPAVPAFRYVDAAKRPGERLWLLFDDRYHAVSMLPKRTRGELVHVSGMSVADIVKIDTADGGSSRGVADKLVADAKEMWLALATRPLLREGENEIVDDKLISLRLVLLRFLREWSNNGPTKLTNEACTFEKMWDVIFGELTPRGVTTSSMDTTMAASKMRKLKTYHTVKNVRGRQADKAWVTSAGVVLAWCEGKKGSWIEDSKAAEEARLKSRKDAKDCIDHMVDAKNRKVLEVFSAVWQG